MNETCYIWLHANAGAVSETRTMLEMFPETWRLTANKPLQNRGLLVFGPNISPNIINCVPCPQQLSPVYCRSARLSSVQHRWSEWCLIQNRQVWNLGTPTGRGKKNKIQFNVQPFFVYNILRFDKKCYYTGRWIYFMYKQGPVNLT